MGTLENAKPVVIICTRDRERAVGFYRETLGLTLAYEDNFAAVFDMAGIALRLSTVADFTPHEHTILGFNVPDVDAAVVALRKSGVAFNIYHGLRPGRARYLECARGAVRVAWFKDPDGNVLSVTNA